MEAKSHSCFLHLFCLSNTKLPANQRTRTCLPAPGSKFRKSPARDCEGVRKKRRKRLKTDRWYVMIKGRMVTTRGRAVKVIEDGKKFEGLRKREEQDCEQAELFSGNGGEDCFGCRRVVFGAGI